MVPFWGYKYGSVCSGIEAASVAWEPLGFKPAWFSEIEAFPSAVLKYHWSDVPNLGDMTLIAEKIFSQEIEAPDILVGGTPCQAFSVAGRRESLTDERGNLTLKFVELANAIDYIRRKQGKPPTIVIWENVPGILNTRDNAFGCFLGALSHSGCELQPAGKRWTNSGCVFGPKRKIAWRTLDAQHFGVAQRRRRVFLISSAREEFNPAEILFEQRSLSGDSEENRKKREKTPAIAATITASGGGISRPGGQGAEGDNYIPVVARTLMASVYKNDPELETYVAAIAGNIINRSDGAGGNGAGVQEGVSYTLTTGDLHAISSYQGVRRLTPMECERLQGFPDEHTLIPYRGKPASDTPRYKAIGNSMAVPVMSWIGKRLSEYLKRKGLNENE